MVSETPSVIPESPAGAARQPMLSREFSRRTALKVGAGVLGGWVAGPALAACSSGSSGGGGGASSGGKAVVNMWSWYTQQQKIFPKLIADFEAKHPTIKVVNKIIPDTNTYLQQMQAAISANNVPEIFAPHIYALRWGQQGISANLTKELGSSFTKNFFASANQEYTIGGAQYALGWMAQTFGVFYDPDTFRAAGINGEPETWDDLISAGKAIQSKQPGKAGLILTNSPGTNGLDFFLPLLTQVTNDPTYFFKLDQGKLPWTDPPVIKALTLVKKIVDAKITQNGVNTTTTPNAEQLLYTGKGGMLYLGSWVPQDFATAAPPSFVKKYKVMQTPAYTSGAKHWCANQAGAGFAVSDKSPNKDAALEFIRYMYSDAVYSKAMNQSTSMPCTKNAAAKVTDPRLKLMTSWLIDGDGCPHIPFGNGTAAASGPLGDLLSGATGDVQGTASKMQAAVKSASGK